MKPAPVHKARIGLITAAIWKNDTENGKPFYNVTVSRQYKNGEGEWQSSDSFNHDDLLSLAKVVERAEIYIAKQQ